MAVTSMWAVKTQLDKTISYVENPEKTSEKTEFDPEALVALKDVLDYAENDMKTEKRMYVSGINCSPEKAYDEFVRTKELFHKTGGRLAYHGYQAFLEGEGQITAELAHEIGVKLAQELWGDRFEVVVATHLNTGHYHNHFVLNSVSFNDGYKFTRTIADYQKMREVSDRLCREAKLNVVVRPKHKRVPYSEWKDLKEKKPSIRSKIREDIDAAIAISYTQKQFAQIMKEMGYSFHMETEDGKPLKYPGINPPGSTKNFRFKSLGDGYDLDEIIKRILKNNVIETRNIRNQKKSNRYVTGRRGCTFRRKYFIFTATLNRHVRRKNNYEYIPMSIREDVYKLDEYRVRTDFLYSNNLKTVEQVEAKKTVREKTLVELETRRKQVYYQLRFEHSNKSELNSELKQLNKEIARLRTEIKVCEEILDTSTKVEDFFDNKYKNKEEIKKNVSRDRDGRAGRKNGAARQRSSSKTNW